MTENTELIEELNFLRAEKQNLAQQVEMLTSKLTSTTLQDQTVKTKKEISKVRI